MELSINENKSSNNEAINSIKDLIKNFLDKEENKRSLSADVLKEKIKKNRERSNDINNNVEHKKHKYNKRFNPDLNDFSNKAHYIETIDENYNLYKYSLNKAYEIKLHIIVLIHNVMILLV